MVFHKRLSNLRIKLTGVFASPILAGLVLISAAQSPATTGVESIRAEELRQKLTYIASEQFKGRGNGTSELNMAAAYIEGIFEKNGLKPAGDSGSYYQHFEIYSSRLGSRNNLTIRNGGETPAELTVRSDFIPEWWSVGGTINGRLEFIDENRSSLSNVKGKIAVETEDRIYSDDPEFPLNATEGRKVQEAGAVGLIVVQNLSDRSRGRIGSLVENFREDLPVRLTPMASVDVQTYPQIPVVLLSAESGRQIVNDLKKPQANITADMTVEVERKLRPTQNVLAFLEGSDPSLKNEVMIIGAHYDHDGEAYGQIWYGADDNGSGTAALLEIAGALGMNTLRPARSVLLCAWAGEEKGLLGSRYYVSHPVFPLNRTVAMFQMDMIGRNEEHPANRSQQVPEERAADNANSLNILGSAFSPDLKTIISRLNSDTKLTLHFRYDFGGEDLVRRSDQWSFLQKGIPSIFFFTGLHPDYHTPRDTADKINYPKLEKVAKLAYLAALDIANAKTRPLYKAATRFN